MSKTFEARKRAKDHEVATTRQWLEDADAQAEKDAMDDCVSEKIKKIMDEKPDMEQKQAIAIAYSYCGEGKSLPDDWFEQWEKAQGDPTDPEMYAYVPDKEHPSTWKLKIQDARHVGLAIAALKPSSEAPHGQSADIPTEARAGVIRKISARIGKLDVPDEKKTELRDALAEVKELHVESQSDSTMPVYEVEPPDEEAKGLSQPSLDATVSTDTLLARKFKALVDGIKALFAPSELQPLSTLTGFKDLGGGYWLAWWTNNFEDREKEIFAEHAIEAYIDRANKGIVPLPELWFWHKEFSKHGKALALAGIGHFGVAVGKYDDNSDAKAYQAYYKAHERALGVSHQFWYPRWALKEGVYHEFNTFEISVLPASRAANPFTSFREVKTMQLNNEQKALFTEILGEDRLNALLAAAEAKGKDIEVDTAYKALSDPELDTRLKALETAQGALATKEEVKALATSIDGLKEFLKTAFGNVEAASTAASTEINTTTPSAHGLMANWLKAQGDTGGKDQVQKSIFDHMFGELAQKGAK
jgi:hypothetical protein